MRLMDLKQPVKPGILLAITMVLWTFFTLLAYHAANGFNPDTTYYISTAAIFNQHGFEAAFSGFSRPFYSILIGIFHKIFGTNYFTSAYIINLIAQLFIILGLFHLAKHLKLKPKHYLWLSVLILISPTIITVRAFIIRDFCFLAAWIFGFTALLQYAEFGIKKQLFLYHLLLLVSILFRSEGVVLWLLMPIGLLFYENGLRKTIYCYLIPFFVIAFSLCFIFFVKPNFLPNNIEYYLSTYIEQGSMINLYHILFSSLQLTQSQEALQYVAVTKIFIYGLPVYFILHIFNGFNYFLSLFLLIGFYEFNKGYNRKLFYWAIAVYLLMLIVYFTQNLFFSSRYQAGMSLLLFIPAAYGMSTIWEKGARHIWLRVVMLVILVVTACYYNWPRPNSRAYQTPAIAWLNQQSGIICSNQRTILFATQKPGGDFQQQLVDLKVDPRIPSTWQIKPEVQQFIMSADCRWIALTLHQAKPAQVAALQQQLIQQLHVKVQYQIQTKDRILWVFERQAVESNTPPHAKP